MRQPNHTAVTTLSRHAGDAHNSLLAFPACGTMLARLSTEIGRWAEALIEKQPDIHQWQVALNDGKA
jgi:hypothetical protein